MADGLATIVKEIFIKRHSPFLLRICIFEADHSKCTATAMLVCGSRRMQDVTTHAQCSPPNCASEHVGKMENVVRTKFHEDKQKERDGR